MRVIRAMLSERGGDKSKIDMYYPREGRFDTCYPSEIFLENSYM